MFPRLLVVCAVLTSLSGGVFAQTAVPQTYSYTEDPAFPLAGPGIATITRDGSKEVVEQTMPAGVMGRQKEYHGRIFYDFQAYKLYTQVMSDPGAPCGIQDLTDATAPSVLDPIGADLLKELVGSKGTLTQVGTETMDGIPSKVMKLTAADGNGKVWMARDGGYTVRIDSVAADGKATTLIEIKNLSFAKPPAGFFAPPANCIGAQAAIKPTTHVTAVTLQPIPKYVGACPAKIKLTGTITTDGPGKVFYQFGAGEMAPGVMLTFEAAGTKTVSGVMTLQPTYGNNMGGGAILEAIGTDDAGKHELAMKGSNNSDFTITCTSGGGK